VSFGYGRTGGLVVASPEAHNAARSSADFPVNNANTNGADRIQAAINKLTAGRTWVETVNVIGPVNIESVVTVPSYTRINMEGSVLTLADAVNDNMFENSDRTKASGGNKEIYFTGGVLKGNRSGQTPGATSRGISLIQCGEWALDNITVEDFEEDGVRIAGVESGEGGLGQNAIRSSTGTLRSVIAKRNGGNGIYVRRAMRRVAIDGCEASYNDGTGILLDASEVHGTINHCFSNRKWGMSFTNGHTNSLGSWVCTANGYGGQHVFGLVNSNFSFIAKNNWQQAFTINSRYSWTASSHGTNEFYMSPAPPEQPFHIMDDDSAMIPNGTIGSLPAGVFAWGNNDTNAPSSTVYARLSDSSDPDASTMIFNAGGEVTFDHVAGTHGTTNRAVGTIVTDSEVNLNGIYLNEDPVDPVDLNTGVKWTLSSNGTNEYFLEKSSGGNPRLWATGQPGDVNVAGSSLTAGGTLGALSAGEWGWGDNAGNTFQTVYTRLSDSSDPNKSVMTSDGITYPLQASHAIWFGDSGDGDAFFEGVATTDTSIKSVVATAHVTAAKDGVIRHPPNNLMSDLNITTLFGANQNQPLLWGKEDVIVGDSFAVGQNGSSGQVTVTFAHGLLTTPSRDDLEFHITDIGNALDFRWDSPIINTANSSIVEVRFHLAVRDAGATEFARPVLRIRPQLPSRVT